MTLTRLQLDSDSRSPCYVARLLTVTDVQALKLDNNTAQLHIVFPLVYALQPLCGFNNCGPRPCTHECKVKCATIVTGNNS